MALDSLTIPSPVDSLVLTCRGDRLCGLSFHDRWDLDRQHLERFTGEEVRMHRRATGILVEVRDRIAAYFGGRLDAIEGLPIEMHGTPFQRRVWNELLSIPTGKTISYGTLARRIGRPDVPRAVGSANGKNPVAIVVPCHRVIGQNGTLTGYGGGLVRKRWLLEHEGVALQGELFVA